MWPSSCPRAPKEVVERAANVASTFEIGEVSAVSDRDQASVWNRSRDMRGDLAGEEVVIARDDQGRNAKVPQLGQQIVAVRLPGVGASADLRPLVPSRCPLCPV